LALNMLWVPRFGVLGAIYAGAAAYALIDVFCVAALWRPLTGAALLRRFLALGVALAFGAGLAAVLAKCDFSRVVQAVASAAALLLCGGIVLRRRLLSEA
jgi:hypothetical protein